jgi:hypothetical protein
MKVNTEDLLVAEAILLKGEHVEGSVTQRRIGPVRSLTSPTSVLVTDKRIIVIKRAIFGFRHDHEVFSLSSVTSIKLKHGFISSSIFIRTQGSEGGGDSKKDNGRQEGEIFGLRKNEAQDLASLINRNLAKREASDAPNKPDAAQRPHEQARKHEISHRHDAPGPEHYEFCSKCGAKILKTAKFCRSCGTRVT